MADHVRRSTFEDALNTFNNTSLVGPPSVEFAPYGKVPSGKRRTDTRAGTIDQDPEFMAFLEGLANPDTIKEGNVEPTEDPKAREVITITPLVQFLKDKKANKSKETALKAAKKQENKGKGKDTTAGEDTKRKGKDKVEKVDKLVEKAAIEAVKILNREVASKSGIASPEKSTKTSSNDDSVPKLDVNKIPASQRSAAIAAHVRMLKRDLGLGTAQAHRQLKRDIAEAQKTQTEKCPTEPIGKVLTSETPTSKQSFSSPSTNTVKATGQNHGKRSRGKITNSETLISSNDQKSAPNPPAAPAHPIVLLKKPQEKPSHSNPVPDSSTPAVSNSSKSQSQSGSNPGSRSNKKARSDLTVDGSRQAFIKHANASQGITEQLLKQVLEKFGNISMVEIDKKKGFAYVDFEKPEGLRQAMAANPITVAQGTVQVMQRKMPTATNVNTGGTPSKSHVKGGGSTPKTARGGGSGGGGNHASRRSGRGGKSGVEAVKTVSATKQVGSEAGKALVNSSVA